MANKKPLMIGIAGGSGSGKSTFVNNLKKNISKEIDTSVLSLDAYYRDRAGLPLKEREKINYDHPSAFDFDLFVYHLEEIVNGHDIEAPQYDFVNHARKKEKVKIKTNPVMLIEGILLFTEQRVRDILEYKIFVEVPTDIRLIRRLERDRLHRGRSTESVINQYLQTVAPMYATYVEPTKAYADIFLPIGGNNKPAVDIFSNAFLHMAHKNADK